MSRAEQAAAAGAAGGPAAHAGGRAGAAWEPEPLPRGRHGLDAGAVRASQRERLLRAMLECVAADGFAATTVPKVASAARVSPNAFYTHFGDKLDCFLELCDAEASRLLDALMQGASEPDWRQAVRNGTRVYLDWWRDQPAMSRAYLVELPMAGERAVARRGETHRRFIAMFEALAARARAEQPSLAPVPPVALRVLVAGMTELVAQEVREGRLAELDRLEDELNHLVIRFLSDDATAAAAANGERA